MTTRLGFRLAIYGVLLAAFWLGLPSFHYAAAVIVALLLRHRDDPGALFRPVAGLGMGAQADPSPRARRTATS